MSSGSPLVSIATGELIGITSYIADAVNGKATGFNDCESSAPSVFTRVVSYLDWICDKTGLECQNTAKFDSYYG
jgi:trypsin